MGISPQKGGGEIGVSQKQLDSPQFCPSICLGQPCLGERSVTVSFAEERGVLSTEVCFGGKESCLIS